MRAIFTMPTDGLEIEMNITYSFIDDPNNEMLVGNITWTIPDLMQPAHWIHAEDPCKCYHFFFFLVNNWNIDNIIV